MRAILPGRIHTAVAFEKIMRRVLSLRSGRLWMKVLVGGAGAWQLALNPAKAAEFGVDYVMTGYSEDDIAEVAQAVLAGALLPFVLPGRPVEAERIPPILGPTTAGVIEVSRGCGLGCRFCALRKIPMEHLPESTILADAATNFAAGARAISLASEDLFRYGGRRLDLAPERVISLIESLRRLAPGALIQADHGNLCSVARMSDAELRAVRRGLTAPGQEFVWLNIGVETVNGFVLERNGGGPKMAPFGPEAWPEAAREQVMRLVRAGFLPLISVVLGLPGEEPGDIEALYRWVYALRNERIMVFPLLFAPQEAGAPARGPMNRERWRLFQLCYDINFRWAPRLVAEHERLGGAPLWRRLAVQVLGHAHIVFWRARFRYFAGAPPT